MNRSGGTKARLEGVEGSPREAGEGRTAVKEPG